MRRDTLRVAQVAPLFESVPPALYGGTERVVSYLTEELVRQGHEVSLFASGDSRTAASLVPACERALRLDGRCIDRVAPHVVMLERFGRLADRFDVVHFHVDYLAFPWQRRLACPAISTLHGRLDLPELELVYQEFREVPLASISMSQRGPLPGARWAGCVPHGLPPSLYGLDEGGAYLAFIGRISPEKGVADAIRIAQAADVPLKIAAKIEEGDRAHFERDVQPLLGDPRVELVGEIGEVDKQAFLGRAKALIFFIDWPEPFGLAMIEALACGTPVIARRRGAVPEVIEHGVSGFIVETPEEAVEAVRAVDRLPRAGCRSAFEARFTAQRMAEDYVRLYRALLGERARRGAA